MPKQAIASISKKAYGSFSLGIDEKNSPDSLQPGRCADAYNVLLDEILGQTVPRQGSLLISTLPSGLPARDGYVYTQTSGTTYLLASDGATLYYTTDPTIQGNWTSLVTSLTATAFMSFETIENKVWMSNGVDAIRTWDGTNVVLLNRTFTSTTNLTTVSSTSFVHAGLTSSDSYWVNQKLVFTVGSNVGTVVTVTAYTESSQTIVFTPAVSGIAATDRFVVGLNLSPALVMRVWDGHLFLIGTVTDPSAALFNRLTDPDIGTSITTDNPRAWPSNNSVSIYPADGDKLWCVSPVYRDRIALAKGNGIFRLERDPITIYRPELIDKLVGSRFNNSWAVKGDALYFLGQERDGYPNVFKTDMYAVRQVDEAGGLDPTLRGLKQPNSVQRNISLATSSQFDAGSKSTTVNTASNVIAVGNFDTESAAVISGSNVDNETNAGQVGVLGAPQWDVDYEGTVIATSASPAWTVTGSFSPVSTAGGDMFVNYGVPTFGTLEVFRSSVLSSGQDAFATVKFRFNTGSYANDFNFRIANGVKSAQAIIDYASQSLNFNGTGVAVTAADDTYHTIHILLKANGTSKCWFNGVLISSAAPTNSSENAVVFGVGKVNNSESMRVTRVGYCANFKGDSLSESAGVNPKTLPDTLPSSGNVVVQTDFTRTPDALRRVFWTERTGASLATCGTTSGSLTVSLNVATDMTKFAVGQVVSLRTITSGNLIANGTAQTISTINAGASTITFSAAVGVVSTDATVGVYPYLGSLTTKSWTASSSDFNTGYDPAGYVSVLVGATPTSLAKRYQRLQVTITKQEVTLSPNLITLATGILWVSPAELIGAAIGAWRSFTDTITTPSGTAQTIQIRRATVTTTPVESDWGAWFTIVSGNNIGTILSDASPTSRWVQLKVEQGVSSVNLLPYVSALQIEWTEGSAVTLPLVAVVRKRRYMFCAATSTAAANNIIIVYDKNDAPVKYTGLALNCFLHFQNKLIGFDAATSSIYQLDVDNVYTDNGVAINSYVDGPMDAFGSFELRKAFRSGYIHFGSQACTFTVYYKRPLDSAFTGGQTFTIDNSGKDVSMNFPIGLVSRKLQRRYQFNTAGQYFKLIGETIYFDSRGTAP